MALNGIDPVVIFTFGIKERVQIGTTTAETFIPLAPIPFYLSENVFEIVFDEPEQTMMIDVEQTDDMTFERKVASDARFTIRASKDNVLLKAFLALFETVFSQKEAAYIMTVYYDDVFMLDASLKDFSKRIIDGTDTREISFTLTNRPSGGVARDYILKNITESLLITP